MNNLKSNATTDRPCCKCHGQLMIKKGKTSSGKQLWECAVKAKVYAESLRLEWMPAYQKRYRWQAWLQFLNEYGSVCVGTADGQRCPEQQCDPLALTIGHMNGDGAKHRRELSGSTRGSGGMAISLRSMGWPRDRGIATQCACCQ